MPRATETAAALLGGELARADALHGGDLSEIQRIVLTDGREAVVKSGPAPRVEAAMLEAIAASGAPAPAVLAVTNRLLVLESLPDSGRVTDAWAGLGSALAMLHGVTGPRYGWGDDYAFDKVRIINNESNDWPAFWAQYRLLVHLSEISSPTARRIEKLAADLVNRLPARPRAALLHGDLWGGNVLVADGRVSGLIDPACYFGHVEVDVAMITLFDHPSAEFYATYGDLEGGHVERLAIYQLWPALVHWRLFGCGYAPLVERLLTAVGA